MAQTIDDIQSKYIVELREIAPSLRAWWSGLVESAGEDAVWFRWPTGLAGHPRFIAIFRRYYFEIEKLNEKNKRDYHVDETVPDEERWGIDHVEPGPIFERHVDRLVFDVKRLAPDVGDLVDGMCFVPVGIDDVEDAV